MENPEVYSASASQGRESLGEGSADLEKLLQTAEAENLQMVKLIDTERQKSTEFQKQIEETVTKTEQLEDSTKNLDIEAKQLHNKFKQNREICEGLKKTSTVLDEHEEALRKKLEMVTLEQQTQLLQHQQEVEKYENIWASYAKKYEGIPMAKELSTIKKTAMKTEASVREVAEQITKIQSQIIEMEVEKTHMQEYLQGNPEKATDVIIKIAGLFLDAETTATKAREKVRELQQTKDKLESMTQAEMELAENENETNVITQNNETLQVMAEPVGLNEPQQSNEVAFTSRPSLNEHQIVNNIRQEMIPTTTSVSTQAFRMSGEPPRIQMPQAHQRSQGGDLQDQQNSREQVRDPSVGEASAVQQVSTPSSNQHNTQQGTALADPPGHQTQQPVQESVVVTNHAPNTPSATGHVTPANQSAAGTPVNLSTRSPLDFNNHVQYMRKVTQSPGEGFTYTGRSMYGNNNNDQVNEHQPQEAGNQEKEAAGLSYEAPLNDQVERDISLNFFQPFEQQQEKQDQNLFQANSEQSPSRNRNIFMRASPSNLATSSPSKGFSFGSSSPNVESGTNFLSSRSQQDASTAQAAFSFDNSSSDAGNNFLSSSSPRGMFGQDNNQENESFDGGFSLFGSSSSPNHSNEDNSGGFSFNFGSKSPSNSNNGSSGFFMF